MDNASSQSIKALDFIKRGWVKHSLAQDSRGREIGPQSSEAVRWCAIGALIAAYGNSGPRYHGAIKQLERAIGAEDICSIVDWNNALERTHAEVIEAFQKAGV